MKGKFPLSMSFLLLLPVALGVRVNAVPSMLQVAEIEVINPSTGNCNFTFSHSNATVGTRFNATVWISDVSDLFGWQVYLSVNDTLLNITDA